MLHVNLDIFIDSGVDTITWGVEPILLKPHRGGVKYIECEIYALSQNI